jgi:hypothetical protein
MIGVMNPRYVVTAGAVFASILLIAFAYLHTYRPFVRVGPASQVTTFRPMLALLAGVVGERSVPAATGAAPLSLSVAALDGVDGAYSFLIDTLSLWRRGG